MPTVQVNADRVSLKLIPDCKALLGAPDTTISLTRLFAGKPVDTGERQPSRENWGYP